MDGLADGTPRPPEGRRGVAIYNASNLHVMLAVPLGVRTKLDRLVVVKPKKLRKQLKPLVLLALSISEAGKNAQWHWSRPPPLGFGLESRPSLHDR